MIESKIHIKSDLFLVQLDHIECEGAVAVERNKIFAQYFEYQPRSIFPPSLHKAEGNLLHYFRRDKTHNNELQGSRREEDQKVATENTLEQVTVHFELFLRTFQRLQVEKVKPRTFLAHMRSEPLGSHKPILRDK